MPDPTARYVRQRPRRWLPAITDPAVMTYRLRTVRIGVYTTFIALGALVLFLFLPHAHLSNRPLFVVLVATALGGVLVVWVLPWKRLFESGYGVYVMYIWSIFDILLITAFVSIMGESRIAPLLLYSMTTVFFAASYPPSGQIALLLFTFACYLASLVLGDSQLVAGNLVLNLALLSSMAFMASYLSSELMNQMRAAGRAHLESERRAALLRDVASAGRNMTLLGLDRVMEVVVASALKLGFEAAEICAVDEESHTYSVIHHVGLPDDYVGARRSLEEGIVALAWGRGRAVTVEDYAGVPGAIPAIAATGFKSVVACPLFADGEIVAVLSAGTRNERKLGDEDVEAFELLAGHAGRAWENANKYRELKLAEEALRASIAERDKAQEQHEMLEAQLRQSQKMEAVGQLAGGIAHDFNNLLGVIQGYAQFIAEGLGSEDPCRADVDALINAAGRASVLTQQLLTFSRREHSTPQIVNVNEAVTSVEQLLRRTIRESIDLVFDLDDTVASIRIGSGHLDQVLMNMAVNARDAMLGGGTLTIRTALVNGAGERRPELPAGDQVLIEVTDTGVGMNEEVASRIFEPFYTTKAKGGTGLGLATAYGIVTQAGGHIFVDSEPGRGTKFEIYLPACEDQAESTGASDALVPSPASGETILVVEDEVSALRLAQRILGRHGYNVLVAESGFDALDQFGDHLGEINLLVTDVVMPGMSGKELHDRLCAAGARVPTLFMSGYPHDIVAQEGLELGEGNYLQKPFAADDLLARVGELLRD
ncbi:MAG: ATP-binding protein [Actinomycetota bacterium]